MRYVLSSLLLLIPAVPALRADDKPTKAAEEFRSLKKECSDAQHKFKEAAKKLEMNDDPAKQKALEKQFEHVQTEFAKGNFAKRFLDIARKNSEDPVAVEAINQALRNCQGPEGPDGVWPKAIALLQKDFVKSADLKPVMRVLAGSGDDLSIQFLRDVLEKNPNHAAQAHAARGLRDIAEDDAQTATDLKEDREMRSKLEKEKGKEFVAQLIAKGPKARAEKKEMDKLLKSKYSDVIPDLSVGQKMPEAVSEDLEGKKVKLSDLKGKVIVLDFWATWCKPCRALIPPERKLVEKLKDKPFVLVGISADEEKQKVKDFLERTKMPWTHWWSGPDIGMVDDWNVKTFPSIYVIDAKGVIRLGPQEFYDFGEERATKLAELVSKLVKEAEEK
jgi:thiol-disulfide isomerase/thioredoxin